MECDTDGLQPLEPGTAREVNLASAEVVSAELTLSPSPTCSAGRLLAKTGIPWQGYLLPRLRLRQAIGGLNQGGVVAVVAGPGCGKSAFLVEVLTGLETERRIYYAVDEQDQDARSFLMALLSSLESRFSGWFRPLLSQFAGQEGVEDITILSERFVAALDACVSEPGPSGLRGCVAFDDLHLAGERPEFSAFLQFVVDHLPAGWLLLLASRSPLPVTLKNSRGQGRVLEVTARSLRLTPKEVGAWARECWKVELNLAESRTLWRLSEGWPAALVLLGERLRQAADKDVHTRVATLLRKGKNLNAYLAEQVLAGLDGELFAVLAAAAQLPRVIMSRDASFLPDEAAYVLADLADRGFFVVKTGNRMFSLHPLIRGFIQRELRRRDTEGATELAIRAARHLESFGCMREATSIYLAEGRITEAVRPLKALALSVLNASLPFADVKWLDQLPDEVTGSDPWLLLVRARLLQSKARFSEAQPLFRSAARLLERAGEDGIVQAFLGEAFCLYVLGRWEESLGVLRRAEAAARSPDEKSEVLCNMGTVLLNLCRWDEAVERFEVALAQQLPEERQALEARVDVYRARLFFLRGQYRTAVRYAERGAARTQRGPLELHATALNSLATILVQLGEYERAKGDAETALAMVRSRGWSFMEPPVLLSSAGLYAGIGDIRASHQAVKEAIRISRAAGDVEAEVWAEDMLGDICRRNGSVGKALEHHRMTLAMSKEHQLSWYEIVRGMAAMGMDLAVAGKESEAMTSLRQAEMLARKWGIRAILAHVRLYEGWLSGRSGGEKAAGQAFAEAIGLCGEGGCIHFLLQESSVCTPILALAARLGHGAFLAREVVPRMPSRLRAHYAQLAEGDTYPLDVDLGGPSRLKRSRGSSSRKESLTDEEVELGKRVAALTGREMEIFRLIGLGMPNKVIAGRLFITEKTVKTHTNRLFKKLGVSNRLQAAISLQSYQRIERLAASPASRSFRARSPRSRLG